VAETKKNPKKKSSRFAEETIQECLSIMENGNLEECFEIIPRIGVLRDPRFSAPLLATLRHKDVRRREFAAYSMGAIGSREFLEPLKKAFIEAEKLKGSTAEELHLAIIEAIGVIGDDAAVEFFMPMLKKPALGKRFRKIIHWILESLGTIAQQGGERSVKALLDLTKHRDTEIQAMVISELSVAYWHRPNEIAASTIERLYDLTTHADKGVAESALSALQSLADVGCRRAESLFAPGHNH
jgi:HEAT repeat protein